jgi:hypothetical protein
MTDRIYLSLWLKPYAGVGPLAALDRALDLFPVSRFKPRVMLRVFALELTEPAILDREFEEANVEDILEAAREFENADCAYEVTIHWDLWQSEETWALAPAPVSVLAFGPEFETDLGDQLRVDLGQEHLFLPGGTARPNWTALRSNVRSLLRLSGEIESRLPVSRRTLWSDSEEDMADRMEEVISAETD